MNDRKQLRVVVADDHPIVRHGIADLLNSTGTIKVVTEAVDGFDALEACTDLEPDVLVVDLRMPGLNGIEVAAILAVKRPKIRVLVLTTYENDAEIHRAIEAGARGYLLKASSPASIISAIEAVAAGQTVLGPAIAERLARHSEAVTAVGAIPAPSRREIQVLNLLAKGRTNSEIARELSVAEPTINAHLRKIFTKLGAKNRTHAVTIAQENGFLVTDPEE